MKKLLNVLFVFGTIIISQVSNVNASVSLTDEQKGLISALKGYRTTDVNSGLLETNEGKFYIKKGVKVQEESYSISVSFCKENGECPTIDFKDIISFSYMYTSYGQSQDYYLDPSQKGWGSNSEEPTYHKIKYFNR